MASYTSPPFVPNTLKPICRNKKKFRAQLHNKVWFVSRLKGNKMRLAINHSSLSGKLRSKAAATTRSYAHFITLTANHCRIGQLQQPL
jgi:hypothetical protein